MAETLPALQPVFARRGVPRAGLHLGGSWNATSNPVTGSTSLAPPLPKQRPPRRS